MSSTTRREGARTAAPTEELEAHRRAPGKQARSDGEAPSAPSANAIQLRSTGGARDRSDPGGAGDWVMNAGLMSAMGLRGQDAGADEVAAPVQRKASAIPPAWAAMAPIQAHGLSGGGSIPDAAPSGSGSPLPGPVLQKMEGAFDTSFADVRVHQGGNAAQLGALAYAQGNDLHFAPGQYDPGSDSGQRLIGHELTHVVQQRQGRVTPQGKDSPINSDASLEAEADDLGDRAARGESVRPAGATGSGGVQRAVIQRKGETLMDAARLDAQGKGVVLTQKTTKQDPFNLAHKEGEMNMWVNETDKSMDANPRFEQDARRFEARLGRYLANDSAPVLNMAAALTTRARAVATAAIEAKHKTARKDLGEWFGSDGVSRIGAVGKDEGVLDEVFAEGNLRERMTVIFNFMWAFSDYLINLDDEAIGKITKDTKLDGESFLNKTAIMKDHTLVKRAKEDEQPPEGLSVEKELKKKGDALDRETLTATPTPNTIVGQQYETRIGSGASATTSGMTTAETMKSHKLSKRELRHMFQDRDAEEGQLAERHAGEEVPWVMGYKLWAMNENHEWVQTMRKLSLPTAAGPSATAWRMVKTAKHLGFGDRATLDMVRLAAAGYLLTIGAHSLMEVLDGAAPEGVSPHNRDQTVYTNLPPLPSSFLRETIGGGRFPHEPAEDRSLNTPKGERAADLDEEQEKLVTIVSDQQEPLLPQGTTATYTTQFLNGKKVDPDTYRMDWYWIDASKPDTEQPRAVATERGVDEWQHKWSKAGQYKIFCVLSKVNREEGATSPLTPLGVLRFDHGVAPSTTVPKKHEPKREEPKDEKPKDEKPKDEKPKKALVDDSDSEGEGEEFLLDFDMEKLASLPMQSSAPVKQLPEQEEAPKLKHDGPAKHVPTHKVPMMAWHRTAADEGLPLPVTAIYFDERNKGTWNAKLTVPQTIHLSTGQQLSSASAATVDYYAAAFEDEPVDAMRAAIELWRQDLLSAKPKCDYPQGRVDLYGRVGEEAVREQFFLIGAPDGEHPVREQIPAFGTQGGELSGQNATWVKLIPGEDGKVTSVNNATAWTNFGDVSRMVKWLDKRGDRAYTLYLEVEASYLQALSRDAIPESVFIGLRGELALLLRALKELHEGELAQFLAEIEDKPDRDNAQKVADGVKELDSEKKLKEKEQEDYAKVSQLEMSELMRRAESITLKIEALDARINRGESSILSSDAAPHQYGVTDVPVMSAGSVPGTVREIYQMRTLHLEKSLQEIRSMGKPLEGSTAFEYSFSNRNVPFLGVMVEEEDGRVRIKQVLAPSPASPLLHVGDIIVKLNNDVVLETLADYRRELAGLKAGKVTAIDILRGDERMILSLTPQPPPSMS